MLKFTTKLKNLVTGIAPKTRNRIRKQKIKYENKAPCQVKIGSE